MYRSLENKIRDMLEGKTGAISVSKDRDTMEHDPNDQVTVGTYKSKHFEISPEAQKLFLQGIPKNSNAIDAEQLAIHHDKLFALVKGAMVKKQVSDTDIENAQDHMSKIQYLATKLGLEGKINYLDPHIEKLTKHAGTVGNPFTSKPTEYSQEPRDFDVDNTKQFITRAAKAERKVKIIDDEFNPEEAEMVADKNLGAEPAVVEAAKKVMEKLDPVGKEDKDVNNDGKVDSSDNYLKKRRNAISSAMRASRQKEVQKKVDAESKKQWKKPPQAGTLSAMKKEEVEQIDEIGDTPQGLEKLGNYIKARAKDGHLAGPGSSLSSPRSRNAAIGMQRATKRIVHSKAYPSHPSLPGSYLGSKTANEEVEQIDEVNEKQIRKDLDSGMSHDAVIGKHANKKLTNTDAIRKVIQRHAWDKRMKKEEIEQVEEAVTSNPGRGYHGQHDDEVADQKYSKMHAKVRSLTGTNSTMAKHYLDSTHGRHLAGYEDDHEHIKRDFLKFAKKYKADQFKEEAESIEVVNELDKTTLKNYAFKSAVDGLLRIQKDKNDPKIQNRVKGVDLANKKIKEEAESIEERNIENKIKKDNVARQMGAHAYIQGIKKDMSPSAKVTGREVMKDPKLGSKKIADIYRKLPNPLKKEEVEQVDEGRRGRPPKDPAARAKFYAAVMDEPDQHIMMQLKKAADSEKAYHVTFKNGQKHPVEPEHAKKVMGKYMAMKPVDKKVFQKKVAKSHAHFMKAATEVEKPVAKKPLDRKERMAAIARAAMKIKNKGRGKDFTSTAD